MSPFELRQALHAVLGFRSDIPTATPDQIIAAAKAITKRADDAEQELAKVHEALDEAGVPATHGGLVIEAGLAIGAVDRVRLLVDERATTALRAELDAYRSRGLPPAEAPKPATRDTTALRELLDGLEADAVRAHHPVSAASVRAVRVLVGVSDA